MKKIILIMVIIMFLLISCGTKETVKTNEDFRKEEGEIETAKTEELYYIDDLKIGQNIEGLTIEELEYIPNDTTFIKVAGERTLNGQLIYDAVLDEYSFLSEDRIFEKAFVFDDKKIHGVNSFSSAYFNKNALEWLELSAYTYLNEYGIIPLEVTIDEYTLSVKKGSGSNEGINITKMIPLEITYAPVLEDALTDFDNESIISNGESLYIDYSQYHLVIIPAQPTGNAYKLTNRDIIIQKEANTDYGHQFAIMGEVMNLTFTYDENGLDENDELIVVNIDGPIKDEIITVHATWPTDTSAILVEGNYIYQSSIESFQFSIDSVRDPEQYKVLTFEAVEDKRME